MEEKFNDWHHTSVAIRFADLDKLGHVNNAKYLTYIESARIPYFLDVMGEQINWNEQGIILAKAEVNFAIPVDLDDVEVSIFTHCSRIGGKSFDLSYVITKSDGRTICATALTTLVCYNYLEGKTVAVPDSWREKMSRS
ncbi:MAG: acyl-CoA thioesterase [Flavobacteriales bacterium]|nr:acyl-CoA thioesterase [Flavobacteriales bacterium]